jgi:hypothetical protein
MNQIDELIALLEKSRDHIESLGVAPPNTVKDWFNKSDWFVPKDEAIRGFSLFLDSLYEHKLFHDARRKAGIPQHEKWEAAVQTLRDELSEVIKGTMRIEAAMKVKTENRHSASLAKLLLAAREVSIGAPYAGLSINDSKNEIAVAIVNRVNELAIEDGTKPLRPSARNTKLWLIVKPAMEAAGWPGVDAEAMAKDIQRKGNNLYLRRLGKKPGGDTAPSRTTGQKLAVSSREIKGSIA